MAKVELAPATRDDIREMMCLLEGGARALPARLIGVAARIGDRTIGVGSVEFCPDGRRIIHCDVSEEARKYPVAMNKVALMLIAAARKAGVRRLIATTFSMHPRSPPWLERLGFRAEEVSGVTYYVNDL